MSPLYRILTLLKPHARHIYAGLFCLLLGNLSMLIQPLLWKLMVDHVLQNSKENDLIFRAFKAAGCVDGQAMFVPIIICMLCVGVLGAAATGLRSYLLERVGQRFVLDLRRKIYAHLQSQPLSFFHDRRTGDLLSRVVGDVDTLQEVVINGTDSFLTNIIGMLGVAAILIWLHPLLGVLTVLPVFVTFFLMYRYNKKVKPVYRASRDRLGDVSARLQENLTGVQTVKAFAREDEAAKRFEFNLQEYFTQSLLGISLRAKYMPAVQLLSFIGSVIMIGVGAYLVMHDSLTIGTLLAYRGYWWHLYGPVYSIANINDQAQRAAAAGSRIFELLDHTPELQDAPNATSLSKIKGDVKFDALTFGYPNRPPVIKDLNLAIPAGTSLGLVGSSGAGKSTLLSLLPRFYDPQQGKVLVDGTDVKTITQSSLRQQVGMVLQESFLFSGTVLDNLKFGNPAATQESVERAARDANAHEFIAQLPNGYDTLVGERGVKLSGGQRQRIAIARAFLADPRILLLDEATSAVEPESEALIQQALERLMSGRTTLIVSHRLSIIRPCTQIAVIDQGKLAELGTHDQLLEQNGLYAKMYNMQMGLQAETFAK